MIRPSWDETHMKQAELMAERSLCVKRRVGAVLVRDNRTISQGYNGTGPGCINCRDHWIDYYNDNVFGKSESKTFGEFLLTEDFHNLHKIWSTEKELHAEQNCILWAAREGIATKDSILYTIYSPCINCAKVIHMAGIIKVYYKTSYESDQYGIRYLQNNKILCEQL